MDLLEQNPYREPAPSKYSLSVSTSVKTRGLSWSLGSNTPAVAPDAAPLIGLIIYIWYIHPGLRIKDYLFRSGKGAGPHLERAAREQ